VYWNNTDTHQHKYTSSNLIQKHKNSNIHAEDSWAFSLNFLVKKEEKLF
jgi:hypothetical protein